MTGSTSRTTFAAKGDGEESASRIARIRARRTGITFTPLTITVGEITPGDFVDRVIGQEGIRSMVFGTAITAVTTSWDDYSYGYGRRRSAVEAKRLTTSLGTISYPASFKAEIRRPVSA